jgi:hypothetical protein
MLFVPRQPRYPGGYLCEMWALSFSYDLEHLKLNGIRVIQVERVVPNAFLRGSDYNPAF